tara:strand:- start:60 stop:365 length:306 start_codon:yes stop_codon:yes gene_type:complete
LSGGETMKIVLINLLTKGVNMKSEFKEIKKGTKLITNQLGFATKAIALESIKQGKGFKSVLLVDCKGSEIGFFDEIGSIYVKDILAVCDSESWEDTFLSYL